MPMNERICHLMGREPSEKRCSGVLPEDIIGRLMREGGSRSVPKKHAVALKTVLEETEITADPEDLIFGTFSKQNCAEIVLPPAKLPADVCPDLVKWLKVGPAAMRQILKSRLYLGRNDSREFYECVLLVLDGTITFMHRYAKLADRLSAEYPEHRDTLRMIGENCRNLASRPAQTYWEALQSLWFLFTVLHMENGITSFSVGRMDRYLLRYYRDDIHRGVITAEQARELTECMWLKLSKADCSVTVGGISENGEPVFNELSLLLCDVQAEPDLPGPKLYIRLNETADEERKKKAETCDKVTVLHDEEIIPRMMNEYGFSEADARNYAVFGTGDLCGSGNSILWSEAGTIDLSTFTGSPDEMRQAISAAADTLVTAHRESETVFRDFLPAALLSSVTNDCLETGCDASAGSVRYRFAGIRILNAEGNELAGYAESVLREKFGAEGIRVVFHR